MTATKFARAGNKVARIAPRIMPDNIIFHIDMNSYFASCEQQANPLLRGKPVGVCEHLGGIIIAPSIEAKKLGIKTGTPVWDAKKICPKIVLMPTDPEKYRAITARFLKIFYSYTEEVEKYSIDEAFLNMTAVVGKAPDPWRRAEDIAKEIKRRISKDVGDWIRCSIGIGTNKLIAKIASDMQKPDGLTVVRPERKAELYEKLQLTDIPGIAKRMERNLNYLGIKTLKDLRDFPLQNLVAQFGVMGYHLHKMGQLEASWHADEFGSEHERENIKSMGHAYTLPKTTSDKKLALGVLYKLAEMVGRRLREANFSGNIVHFIVSNKDGEFIHKRKKLEYYTNDGREIFLEASNIFDGSAGQFPKTFRLVGVTVSGLREDIQQQPLFENERRKHRLTEYLDKINDKYGDFTVARVPAWEARNVIRDSIGFGRMKEFKVNYKRSK